MKSKTLLILSSFILMSCHNQIDSTPNEPPCDIGCCKPSIDRVQSYQKMIFLMSDLVDTNPILKFYFGIDNVYKKNYLDRNKGRDNNIVSIYYDFDCNSTIKFRVDEQRCSYYGYDYAIIPNTTLKLLDINLSDADILFYDDLHNETPFLKDVN